MEHMKEYIVVYDNIYINERITEIVKACYVDRMIEALKGQKCPCGYWSKEGYARIYDKSRIKLYV